MHDLLRKMKQNYKGNKEIRKVNKTIKAMSIILNLILWHLSFMYVDVPILKILAEMCLANFDMTFEYMYF